MGSQMKSAPSTDRGADQPSAPAQPQQGPADTEEAKRERLPRVLGHYAKALRRLNEHGDWPIDSDFAPTLDRAVAVLSESAPTRDTVLDPQYEPHIVDGKIVGYTLKNCPPVSSTATPTNTPEVDAMIYPVPGRDVCDAMEGLLGGNKVVSPAAEVPQRLKSRPASGR